MRPWVRTEGHAAANPLLRVWRSLSVRGPRFRLAPERELTNWTLDVKFDLRHFGEQIDIADADRASAQPHVGRHQIERLHQCADILEHERIRDRAVLP